MDTVNIRIIARMHSDFATKFGIPRQSGLVEALRSTIVFEPEFRNSDALRGIEDFSHLWIIWQFSEAVRQAGRPPCARPGWAETPGWRLRHPFPFPPQQSGVVQRPPSGCGADPGIRHGSACGRCGLDGWHPDF